MLICGLCKFYFQSTASQPEVVNNLFMLTMYIRMSMNPIHSIQGFIQDIFDSGVETSW